jgi:hypothetical protein
MIKTCHRFYCKKCDYGTSKKSSYDNHLLTAKHQKTTVNNHIMPTQTVYICSECDKNFNDRAGLWRHKKKCCKNQSDNKSNNETNNLILEIESNFKYDLNSVSVSNSNPNFDSDSDSDSNSDSDTDSDSDKEPSSKEIIKMMKMQMIENKEIRSLIIELLKKETINNQINNNISNNCNNKSFNMNFFLNEQCKDALNINEFVDSIKMQLSDLEEFAHLGYADGVSNIFVKGINALEVHLRPIHCSDTKREVLYIKNNNEWIKETDDKTLIKSAIRRVAFKNIRQINDWVKENPTCKDPTTKKYDQYNQIVMNAMSGVTEEEQKNNIEKIVRNVTKAVAIDKYAVK